ncbi:MAG: Fe-S cluster assembly protein SufD [Spirochaetia bacterium]|nr:Fe-S cluster assembly protein SufD [Spirochaetia bacterium]
MSGSASVPAGAPALLTPENAREYMRTFQIPGRDQESWRKIDLTGFTADEFTAAPSKTTVDIKPGGPGVRVLSLEAAITDAAAGAALRDFLAPKKDHNFFDAFRRAHATSTNVIHICGRAPARVDLAQSIQSGRLAASQVLILVDRESECTITEDIILDAPDAAVLSMPETMVIAGAGSRVNYVNVRRYTGSVYHFHRIRTAQERDSHMHVSIFQTGGMRGKGFMTGTLTGPGAEFRGIGLGLGSEAGFHDIEMLVEHLAGQTQSSLLYKAVLRDRAHSVFDGNLHIPHGTKHVNSRQINHNILLSKKARAESMPRLVVQSHDVQSDHGATVGELDAEALFFLMARGLNESEARSLLVEGFVTEIVDEIPAEDVRARVHEMVHAGLT